MFAQRSPIIIIQNVLGAIFGYVGLFFILRYVGSSAWGFVAFGIGFVGILSLFGDLGFSTAHTIRISEGEDLGVCNGTFLFVKLVLGGLFVGLVIGSLQLWTVVLHRGFESPVEYWIILSLIPYFFFQNFIGFTGTYFRATLKSMRASIPPLIEAMVRNSLFISLGIVMYLRLPFINHYYAALVISSTYSFSYTVYFIVSVILGRPWTVKRPTRRMLKSYAALALPLMFVASVSVISGNIDKVFIQFFWHANPTGAFFTSQQISSLIITLGSSLTVFFLPLLIRYEKNHGKDVHNKSVFEFERLSSLYILPFVVVMVILSPYILNIFSAAYLPYGLMLSLLSLRAYLGVINAPYISSIVSRSNTKKIAKIDTAMILLNIILISVFVPPSVLGYSFLSLGADGAAVSILLVTMVSSVIYRIAVMKMEGISLNLGIIRHAVPAAAQSLIIVMVMQFVIPKSFTVLVGLTLLSFAVYFAVAVAIRETTPGTLLEVLKNFSPSALAQRFKDEGMETEEHLTEVGRP